jgi:hypothetical protein
MLSSGNVQWFEALPLYPLAPSATATSLGHNSNDSEGENTNFVAQNTNIIHSVHLQHDHNQSSWLIQPGGCIADNPQQLQCTPHTYKYLRKPHAASTAVGITAASCAGQTALLGH